MSGAKYAKLSWTAEDIRTLRPEWSLRRCEEFLLRNEKYIQERLVELGWEVINEHIIMDEAEREMKA